MKGKTGVYIDSAVMPILHICNDQLLAELFTTILESTDPGFDYDFENTSPFVASILKILEDGGFIKYDYGDLLIPNCKKELAADLFKLSEARKNE